MIKIYFCRKYLTFESEAAERYVLCRSYLSDCVYGRPAITEPLMLLIFSFLFVLMIDFSQKYMCRIITCTNVNRPACDDEVSHMNLISLPTYVKLIDSF